MLALRCAGMGMFKLVPATATYHIDDTVAHMHGLPHAMAASRDAMRDLIDRASLGTPGRHKVYILDEVHMLSKAAEAVLLKTLEEPPEHVVFVLATTDPQKVSDTIRSRTQHLQFHLLPMDVTGTNVFNLRSKSFEFTPGPVFTSLPGPDSSFRNSILGPLPTRSTLSVSSTMGSLFSGSAISRRSNFASGFSAGLAGVGAGAAEISTATAGFSSLASGSSPAGW